MVRECKGTICVFLSLWVLIACGGTSEKASSMHSSLGNNESSSDLETTHNKTDGPVLTQADLSVAIDASGLKVAAPHSTEFLPDTKTVYLVATLEKLPREADIEVRWTQSQMGSPLTVTHASGSNRHTFSSKFDLAKFVAAEKNPYGQQIQAQIFVNGSRVGGTSFIISDRRAGGMLKVKELSVSYSIEAETNQAVNSTQSFKKGTKKIFASFYVGGLEPGATIRVSWLHEGNLVKEDDIESEGEKRYVTFLDSGKALSYGDWTVEIDLLGDKFAERSFFVGDTSGGSAIEEAALGTSVGNDRMPKNPMTVFKTNSRAIHCGIKFLFASANSKVEINWTSMAEGSESILQTTSAVLKNDGPSSVSMAWRPGKGLKSGQYKAVIIVAGAKVQELPFEIR